MQINSNMRLLAFFTFMIIAKGEKQEKTPLSRFEVGKKKDAGRTGRALRALIKSPLL